MSERPTDPHLPSEQPDDAQDIQLPPDPSLPKLDRTTSPPGHDDHTHWATSEDSMRGAPNWGRHLDSRVSDLFLLLRELPALLRQEVDERIRTMLEQIERQFSVLMARDHTRETAIGTFETELRDHDRRLVDLDHRLRQVEQIRKLEDNGK